LLAKTTLPPAATTGLPRPGRRRQGPSCLALGLTACAQGHRTLLTTAAGLSATFGKALAENRPDGRLKLLTQPHLVIIDEVG
jgi:hypothetical protein